MVKITGTRKDMARQRVAVGELLIGGLSGTRFEGERDDGTNWYVNSVTGSSGNDGKSVNGPKATLASVLDDATLAANDSIWLMASHVETVTAAAGLDVDTAGLTIYFLGHGANKARITFSTDVAADMDIDAANITLVNPLFVAGIDALTGPIDVNAADFTIYDGEWRDAAAMGTTDCIVADANADRMVIDGWTYIDSTTGTQKQSNIQVAAADDIVIKNFNIVGDFGTGAIENGTAWVTARLEDGYINNKSASPTVGILLQATSTGVMRNVDIRIASGVTYLTVNNDMEFFNCYGTGIDATAGESIGTSVATGVEGTLGEIGDAAATGAVTSTDTLVAYTKQLVTQMGVEADTDPVSAILSGAGGITTWKSAAAPATGISMSEVVRAIYDAVAADGTAGTGVQTGFGRRVTKTGNIATSTDALFTVTGKNWITLMVGEVTSVIATTTSLQLTTSVASVAMNISTDIITDVVNTLYVFTGDKDEALNGDGAGTTAIAGFGSSKSGHIAGFLMNDDGIIQSVQAAGTGTIQWDLYYIPLEASASITSAA